MEVLKKPLILQPPRGITMEDVEQSLHQTAVYLSVPNKLACERQQEQVYHSRD